jgi:hypothetical protein
MVSTRSGRTSSSDNADAVIVHSKTTKPARQTKSKQKKVEDAVVEASETEAAVPAPAEIAEEAVVKSKATRQPKSKQMKIDEVAVESSKMEVPLPEPVENPEPVILQEPKATKPARQTKSRQKKVVEVPVESSAPMESSVPLVVPAAIIEEPIVTQNTPEPVLPSVTPKRNKRELEEQQQPQENDIAIPELQTTTQATVSRPVTSNKKPKLEESSKKKERRQPSLAPKNLLETELSSVVLLPSD